MSKIVTLSLLCAGMLVFSQCATKKAGSGNDTAKAEAKAKEAAMAAELEEMKTKYSAADLAEGKLILETNCVKCHKVFPAESRNIPAWEHILPGMIGRTKLNEAQASKLRAYVLLNAKK